MRVLMLVLSDVYGDARVLREAAALAAGGASVHVIGAGADATPASPLPDGVTVSSVAKPTGLAGGDRGRHLPLYRAARWALLPNHRAAAQREYVEAAGGIAHDIDADIVHAHDFPTLGLAARIAARRGARLVYDAHECWHGRAREGRPEPLRRARERSTEQALGARADAVLTVSPALADWLGDHYGWSHVHVVHNSFPAAPEPPHDRAPTGLVYAGRLDRKRDLHTVIAAAPHLPDLPVTLVGPASSEAAGWLPDAGVRVLPPVSIPAVTDFYREAGLALVTLADGVLNHRLALPNKLFQAIQAGVPVVAADLPELRRFVTSHGIGTLYTPGDPVSLVGAARQAQERHPELRTTVRQVAPQLVWDHDARTLLEVYDRLATVPR